MSAHLLRAASVAVLLSWVLVVTHAQQRAAQSPAIDTDDIGGVVTGPNGPEAGVWVIAETRDLPVRYIKSVVTDDRGRYVVPDLPKANYSVWARGYGLVDSPKVTSAPGRHVNLTATPAPNEAAAAHYYPAIYWYSMLKIPGCRSSSAGRASIPAKRHADATGSTSMKNNGCVGCHQLGQLSTRTIPGVARDVRLARAGLDAARAVRPVGPADDRPARRRSAPRRSRTSADWTDRIAKGELPHAKPPRPQGVERNIVVTLRDWMNEQTLPARSDRERQALPDRQRLRPALRIAGVQLGQ